MVVLPFPIWIAIWITASCGSWPIRHGFGSGAAREPDKLVDTVQDKEKWERGADSAGAPEQSSLVQDKEQAVSRVMVKKEDEMVPLAEFYHGGSSYPALTRLSGATWRMRPAEYKRYRDKPETPLPKAGSGNGTTVIDAGAAWRAGCRRMAVSSMTLAELSTLLHHTQGITGRAGTLDLRSAPSAGALYPVDIYVAAGRVQGIEAGLYHFNVKANSLVRLKQGSQFERIEAVAGCPHLYQPAAATIIFSVTFGRTGFKYKERAYRYVNMDTGHAAFNLALCAASVWYAAPMVARFDDEGLNELLGVDVEKEAALLLVPLGRAAGGDGDDGFAEPRFTTAFLEEPADGELDCIDLIHRGTGLARTEGWSSLPVHPGQHRDQGEKESVALPMPTAGKALFEAIKERRSTRSYTQEPMEAAELSALCVAARGTSEGGGRDPFLSFSAPLNLYVVVRDVKRTAPGVYLFDPANRSLVLLKQGDFSGQCRSACLNQDFCATADALFVKTMNWNSLPLPDGDRGYRYACLRAGMMGEGLYLQATALGMGVCGVGAFMDGDVAEIVGCDRAKEAVLYATAVGK